MKFFLSHNLKNNSHIKLVIPFFISFIVLFLIGDCLYSINNLGLTPVSITDYYRGNEEKLLEPRGIVLILEEVHIRSFLFGFMLLSLSSLILQTNISPISKKILIITSFTSALMDSVGGIFIAYLNSIFAYLKILSLLGLYISLTIMILIIMAYLWGRRGGIEND